MSASKWFENLLLSGIRVEPIYFKRSAKDHHGRFDTEHAIALEQLADALPEIIALVRATEDGVGEDGIECRMCGRHFDYKGHAADCPLAALDANLSRGRAA